MFLSFLIVKLCLLHTYSNKKVTETTNYEHSIFPNTYLFDYSKTNQP